MTTLLRSVLPIALCTLAVVATPATPGDATLVMDDSEAWLDVDANLADAWAGTLEALDELGFAVDEDISYLSSDGRIVVGDLWVVVERHNERDGGFTRIRASAGDFGDEYDRLRAELVLEGVAHALGLGLPGDAAATAAQVVVEPQVIYVPSTPTTVVVSSWNSWHHPWSTWSPAWWSPVCGPWGWSWWDDDFVFAWGGPWGGPWWGPTSWYGWGSYGPWPYGWWWNDCDDHDDDDDCDDDCFEDLKVADGSTLEAREKLFAREKLAERTSLDGQTVVRSPEPASRVTTIVSRGTPRVSTPTLGTVIRVSPSSSRSGDRTPIHVSRSVTTGTPAVAAPRSVSVPRISLPSTPRVSAPASTPRPAPSVSPAPRPGGSAGGSKGGRGR